MRLDAVTNDNGSRQVAAARRESGRLAIEGSGYSGALGGNPGTTTYWSPAFLKRPVWISTQDGQPLSVTARSGRIERFPTPSGAVDTTRGKSAAIWPISICSTTDRVNGSVRNFRRGARP